MIHRLVYTLWMMALLLWLTACSTPTPPLEFTPDGETLEKAITLQLNLTQQRLSEQLKIAAPTLDISNIKVEKNEPVFINDLAAYHLTGTYQLKLILPRQEVTQRKNPFDIYLQLQAEGKTWRLLWREGRNAASQPQWSSYLIE